MNTMNILLEDKWNENGEAQDIIDHYNSLSNCKLNILNSNQLQIMDSETFINSVYFCNTQIVQYHLERLSISMSKQNRLDIIVPDTYESVYKDYYKRDIDKVKFIDININRLDKPIFIKPTTNDKCFDGYVISKEDQFTYEIILQELKDIKYYQSLIDNLYVYRSEVINIRSEYRLLIGNGKMYGSGHISGIETDIDKNMCNNLVFLSGNNFRCIDIGLADIGWIIIEINPPFSLDDHKIPFYDYIRFCSDSCKWISNVLNI